MAQDEDQGAAMRAAMAPDVEPPPAESGVSTDGNAVGIDPYELEMARSSSWKRRWQAEADRCEMLEGALLAARRTVAQTRVHVADLEGELRALREKYEPEKLEDEGAVVALPQAAAKP